MEYYFDEYESIYSKSGVEVKPILETIARRYMGQNPVSGPVFRVFNQGGFIRTGDYRYIINFGEKYPDAGEGVICYAWGKRWSEIKTDLHLAVNCYSPVRVFWNEQLAFKSNIVEETNDTVKKEFTVRLNPGWNSMIVECKKVRSGFGCILGTASFKRNPVHFLAPTLAKEGQEGLIFTGPLKQKLDVLPSLNPPAEDSQITWYPNLAWSKAQHDQGQFERVYGLKPECLGFAWTKGVFDSPGNNDYEFQGSSNGPITIYLEGQEIFDSSQATEFHQKVAVTYGEKDILIKCGCGPNSWGFKLNIRKSQNHETVNLRLPFDVKGAKDAYLYAGVFDKNATIEGEKIRTSYQLFPGRDGQSYWRVDMPDSWVRAYHENELFGKWNYPLGVTLYGLLQSGLGLKNDAMIKYVQQHIEFCTAYYQYSGWDRQQFGAAGINSQISAIDSLDDCGAFGATMLELLHWVKEVNGAREVARDIAHYITAVQSRQADGALYRSHTYNPFMEQTMWADDLYMSVPFLCKYYRLTGEKAYIDDAAAQLLLYKKYLYMADLKIMSHVYNFRYHTATGIPWGRGNGWVFFTLSELLAVLPKDHESRNELINFFNDLSEGYLRLQDGRGMWHQVLTDHESYPETSCTSMFLYGFARGIRYGWLKAIEPYLAAVFKGWEGLSKIAVDKNGNIYGVCRGSGYSFSADYYKDDLLWLLNDTHGIGIVMLAGMEVDRLQEYLAHIN